MKLILLALLPTFAMPALATDYPPEGYYPPKTSVVYEDDGVIVVRNATVKRFLYTKESGTIYNKMSADGTNVLTPAEFDARVVQLRKPYMSKPEKRAVKVMLIGQLADVVTTVHGLGGACRERNPILVALAGTHPSALQIVAFKALPVAYVWRQAYKSPRGFDITRDGWLMGAFGGAAALHNHAICG